VGHGTQWFADLTAPRLPFIMKLELLLRLMLLQYDLSRVQQRRLLHPERLSAAFLRRRAMDHVGINILVANGVIILINLSVLRAIGEIVLLTLRLVPGQLVQLALRHGPWCLLLLLLLLLVY